MAEAQNAAQRAALVQLGRPVGNSDISVTSTNGLQATAATLDRPDALTFDRAGNLFIVDTGHHVIRKVSLAGIISVVAGNGEQGFGGDGGPATDALLDSPSGLAVDSAGNLFIADTHNHRIREVLATSGTIDTIAGTGVAGFSGDGGAATAAQLNLPYTVAVDSRGVVYVADTSNFRIRAITGTIIQTVAGDGVQGSYGDGGLATAAALDSPMGLAVDAAFNLYIADTNNNRIRLVTYATGIITTLAGTGEKGFNGDGAIGSVTFAGPRGLALDTAGNLYVADSENNQIRMIGGGAVTTLVGSGAQGFTGDASLGTDAALDSPHAVAVFGGSLALADSGNDSVRAMDAGVLNTTAGSTPQSSVTASLVIGGQYAAVYGTGSLTAVFSNGGQTGTGLVTFYDVTGSGQVAIAQSLLSGNAASMATNLLSAGTHRIVANYAGDANNTATTSGVFVLVLTPVSLTATANGQNLLYGQAVPALTGTLNTVLAQDAGKVTADFTTTATASSAPGTYPISVALSGTASANYTVTLAAGSGSVQIAKAPVTAVLVSSNATPILGTSLTLTATVASTTSGIPSGTVSFFDGATALNATPAVLNAGVATLTLSTLPVGSHSITAVYSGSTNFLASTSTALSEAVLSPDFTLAPTLRSLTLYAPGSVEYAMVLTPANPTFLYPVTLSVSGLPTGVTAKLVPASVPVGAGVSASVLTLTVDQSTALHKNSSPFAGMAGSTALAVLLLPLFFTRRGRETARKLARNGKMLLLLLALAALGTVAGCGGSSSKGITKTYTVTVTAVSGPVTHTADLTLQVKE